MFSQNLVDVRFSSVVLSNKLSCLDIEVRAVDKAEILLAGQNYRVFYNPSKLKFIRDDVKSYSSKDAYDNIRILKKHHSDEIATAMLNLGIDATKFEIDKIVKLNQSAWTRTAHVCFERTAKTDFDLIWARREKTAELATAFVSMSEWENAKNQKALKVNKYFDFTSDTEEETKLEATLDVRLYPNPVEQELHIRLERIDFSEGIIYITNSSGQQVRSKQIEKGYQTHSVLVDDLPPGSYFVDIRDNDWESLFHGSFIKNTH